MLLLIFLLFFLKNVQTCLVVQSGPYIEMNNCKCEPLRFTTKEDIEANKYSAYLANRPLFQANVTVRDNCMIGIPVQDRMTSYFFMIFRTNGPPIFHTRLHAHMEDPTRLIAAVGFDCVLQEDGEYKWQYGGGVVENPTLTYQSNEDECTCGTFPGSTSIEGFCDVVDVVCPKSTDAAYWMSTNLAFNLMLPKLGNPLISDLLCVSERWHYMGIPLSNVQLTCSDPVSIVDMHSPAPNTNCLCFDIIRITSDNNYMSVYDMDGEFADYTLTPVTFTRDLDCNIPAISCDGDDLMVVFNRNYQPMKYSPGSAPYLMCSKSQAEPSWLRPGSQNASFYWYFDGIMLAEPAVACLSNSSEKINMNGCKCPQIELADKAGVLANPLSAYLANRDIFYPYTVNVTENCEVTVDAPASCEYDDYYFMIFRTNGPPIFNHRFVKELIKDPFNPTGLTCEKVGDSYEWQFYGGKLENMSFALQSNDGMCGCEDLETNGLEIQNLYGTCDIFQIKCHDNNTLFHLGDDSEAEVTGVGILEDATCVDKQWYFNGFTFALSWCFEGTWKLPCGCGDIRRIIDVRGAMGYSLPYRYDTRFDMYTAKNTIISYSAESGYCSPDFQCSSSNILVIFSSNYKPLVYENGARPSFQCRKTPLSLSPGSMSYWFVDGIMLNLPVFGCYDPTPVDMGLCKCPRIEFIENFEIAQLEYGSYLSERRTQSPKVTVSDECQVTVDASEMQSDNFYFMVFRDGAPPIFNRRFYPTSSSSSKNKTVKFSPTDISCVLSNGAYQWEYNGAKINNMRFALQETGTCSCPDFMLNMVQISRIDDQCDVLQFTCENKNSSIYIGNQETEHLYLLSTSSQIITTEATCVNGKWYFNNVQLYAPGATCLPHINLIDNAPDDYKPTPCGCDPIFNIFEDPRYLELYNTSGVPDSTFLDGVQTYSGETPCIGPNLRCPEDSILAVFGRNVKPKFYLPDQTPVTMCKKSPLAENDNLNGVMYWFIDGTMLNEAAFACLVPKNCLCPLTYMDASNIQQLVGNHPDFEEISAYNVSAPNDNCVPDDVCPDKISCPEDKALAVFDSTKYFLFRDVEQSISCNPLTRQWTIGNNFKLDSLYATCVDYPCACPVRFLDDSNLQDIMGYNPFYQNVSKYPISAPLGELDYRCPEKVVCPDGLMLVNFGDYNGATLYPNGSLTASCIGGVTWDLPNSYSLFLHVTCVNYGCSCSFKYLDESNIQAVVGTHPYYQNISSHAISSPDDSCVPDDTCPDKIVCPAGLTLVIFDTDTATTFPNGSIASSCSGAEWSVNGAQFSRLFATCVGYRCACSFEFMDETNIEGLVGTHPFYQNISEHTISPPDDNCVPDDVCPEKIVCPAGLTLVIFDTDSATTFPNGSLSSLCSGAKWSVNGVQFNQLYATCVDYGCSCSFKYLDESNIQEAVGTHPFYQNISAHAISAPDDNCVPDDVCPDKIACPAGLTLVVFDTDSATTFPNGSLSSTCSASKWSVNRAHFSRLFATCVDYGCSCSFKYLDESNIQEAVGTHPFYQNISEHTISAPDDNCVPDDVCPDEIVCPAGLTLVIFDTDSATTFPNGSIASICSGAQWSVNGAQFSRLFATCVDYGCPCSFEYMDQSNIQELVGTHPFYQNISHLTISAPNDNCVSDDVCPESVTCPTGLTLVIFGSDSALSFPSQVPSTCSNSTKHWTIYNTVMDRLYATCVDFVMNGCKCAPIKQLNSSLIGGNSNWAELKNEKIWDTSLSYDIDCNVMESCAGVESSYYTAFFYTDGLPIVINRVINNNSSSPRLIDMLECVQTDNSYQWQLYGYPLQDPSITCVSDMNSCKCPVISGTDKLGEAAVISDRTSGAACGIIEASCPSGGVPKLVSDNLNPITPQGSPIFDDLRCLTKDDGGYQWKFGSLDLINPAISCLKQCACGDLLAIIGKTDLSVYDPSGHFSTYQITPGTWNYQNCAASVNLTCPTDYEPFVFGNGIDYVQVTTKLISCVNNPAAGNMKMWMAEGRRVLDPAVACLKKP